MSIKIPGINFTEGTPGGGGPLVTIIQDWKNQGISGGSSVTNGIVVRTLNTQLGDTSFLTLTNGTTGQNGTANNFELIAGTYHIGGYATGYRCGSNRAMIKNITDGTWYEAGTDSHSDTGDINYTMARVDVVFTIASLKTLALEHMTRIARAGNGLGETVGAGLPQQTHQVFSSLTVTKLA